MHFKHAAVATKRNLEQAFVAIDSKRLLPSGCKIQLPGLL